MRILAAATLLLASLGGPASSQTDPFEIRVGWRDCLALVEEYSGAYVNQGGEILSEIEQEKNRSIAIALKKELIVLRCRKTGWSGAQFSIEPAPL